MYRIKAGSTHGLADTAAFVELLGELEAASAEIGWSFEAGREVVVSRAPGRLDLMGGIADYSGSLVLELPIASATHVALQRHPGPEIEIVSLPAGATGRPRRAVVDLGEFSSSNGPIEYSDARAIFSRDASSHWAAYVAGAFVVLMRERGCVFEEGARILISSTVPEGKGVSSSASLEVAAMGAIAAGYGIEITPRETALLCQRVENFVAGAPCGVMDQMTAACGEAGRLLALLCQPGELRGTVELPDELAVWGVDSGIRHSVGGGDYGTVRAAAFMGYRIIAEAAGLAWRPAGDGRVEVDDPRWGGYLANITVDELDARYAERLPDELSGAEFLERYHGITDTATTVQPDRIYPVRAATEHPIREHARVTAFAELLERWRGAGDAPALGALMYASHASYSACGLGSDGTDELVRLVREAGGAARLYGAKITGGGSGGTVAVLGHRDAEAAIDEVATAYASATGNTPLVISGSSPGAGAFGTLRLSRQE
jgi:L-arabinokinase